MINYSVQMKKNESIGMTLIGVANCVFLPLDYSKEVFQPRRSSQMKNLTQPIIDRHAKEQFKHIENR